MPQLKNVERQIATVEGFEVTILHPDSTLTVEMSVATGLLSHEFRHVYQYEQAGSIAAFLPGYLQQVVQLGYANTAFERDAEAHESVDV